MDIAMVERKVIEAWDKMLDFCPKCEHGLNQHEGYELMGEAVETLRTLHYPNDAYGETKARHDVGEDYVHGREQFDPDFASRPVYLDDEL